MRIALRMVAVACTATFAHAADLVAYTEEWPPYNFSESGTVHGIATDFLRASCLDAHLDCDIQIVPWARAYAMASNQRNTGAFSMARTPLRERSFLWVGPILPRTTWLFSLSSSDMKLERMRDVNRKRIGVVLNSASMNDLLVAGIDPAQLHPEADSAKVLKLLDQSLVDIVVNTEVGMAWTLRSAHQDPRTIKKILKVNDAEFYYYAFNLDSDPILIRRLQSSVDKLSHAGTLDDIVARYAKLPQ